MRGLLLSAAVSLASAILLSAAIDASYQVPGADTLAPISDGFGQLRGIVADFLYLDLDRYHHIMMYQGYDWAQIADYLPQIWMIVKLKPDYWRAYEDGSYHLAVNLGMPDEGMRLLEEGLRNCRETCLCCGRMPSSDGASASAPPGRGWRPASPMPGPSEGSAFRTALPAR